jgi:hypothetical protein
VLAAADDLIDEIDDEDDGLMHALRAIASLLRSRLPCAEEQSGLARDRVQAAAVDLLDPLLAQYACTITRGAARERLPGP